MTSADIDSERPSLIPAPSSLIWGDGYFTLRPEAFTVSFGDLGAADAARMSRLLAFLPFTRVGADKPDPGLRIRLVPGMSPEAYELSVGPEQVRISASTPDGVHYGIQTFRQLLPAAAYTSVGITDEVEVVTCEIQDSPALEWRGALLDVARHFLPKRFVLDFIDVLAVHKYNRLQLHLTDDQGWRVEIRSFPRLCEVGSNRPGSQISHFDEDLVMDETPHGGYYTADDIAEIVRYASDRGITVVPEIELPGHSGALVASYPALGTGGTARSVGTTWGVSDSLVSPLPEVMTQIESILTEVLELFPSRWIHLGGDETLIEVWKNDPAVGRYMNDLGLTSAPQVFSRFMSHLSRWLQEHGRVMISWDDAFANHPQEAADGVVMAWRGTGVAQLAAEEGHDVVLTPVLSTYFDYYQDDDEREPLAIGGPITLKHVMEFDPRPRTWRAELRDRVLGTQFQLWTELIDNERSAQYMTWPRACALAEAAWTGAPADESGDFEPRLAQHLSRLRALGVEFRPLDGPHPWQEGGRGRRRHRQGESLTEIRAAFELAAEQGVTAILSPKEQERLISHSIGSNPQEH